MGSRETGIRRQSSINEAHVHRGERSGLHLDPADDPPDRMERSASPGEL